jgi:molecular chaperone IbpA
MVMPGPAGDRACRRIQRIEIVAAADVGFADEDLRHRHCGGRAGEHFLLLRAAHGHIEFLEGHALLFEQPWPARSRATPFGVDIDFGRSGHDVLLSGRVRERALRCLHARENAHRGLEFQPGYHTSIFVSCAALAGMAARPRERRTGFLRKSADCSTEDIAMNRFDFTPYRRTTVGFDRLFDLLERQARANAGDNYPPFNIERRGEDAYRITLAVAGFKPEDIDITAQQNLLVVAPSRMPRTVSSSMSESPTAASNAASNWPISCAEAADLADGLLTIDLVREVPEAMKPKKVLIGEQKPLKVIEGDASAAA